MRRSYLNCAARLCVAAALALAVAACATPFGERLQSTFSAIGSAGSLITSASAATVEPKAVMVAAGVFDGIQATAKQYLRLPRCTATNGPVCRQPAATRPIINAVHAGRKARNAALKFVKEHPGQLGPGGLYDALQASISTLNAIYMNYDVDRAVAAAR